MTPPEPNKNPGIAVTAASVESASTAVAPAALTQVFPVKNLADLRALLYILTPVAAAAFVTAGWFTQDWSNMVIPLVLAVLNWPLQAKNSVSTWRSYIYNILGAANVIAIAVGWWTDTTWTPWVGLGGMIITNVLAHWFTPTSGTPPADAG